jgi:hypothetical protein
MNWIALFAGLGIATLILAIVTDFEMTRCQPGSLYVVIGLCSPEKPASAPKSFDCRFNFEDCG